ncbi:hypothetical protein MiSe_55310 [Microseira wollei NIES-4236]|uniref:Uncharacterized protein n=1 Tax=Microseira wollei NIES-4236 TaxID=2530354 RepID=A0AAV3XKP9_9CYAN|nr:hypothetical protein MiSe_55310 [Microseira wollei NIES-4236]
MLDSLLPAQSNSLDAFKSGFANSGFNLEPTSDILPPRTMHLVNQKLKSKI